MKALFVLLTFIVSNLVLVHSVKKTGETCSFENNGLLYSNKDDCSTFYQCEYEVATLKHCPPGLLFDSILKVCNWPNQVVCGPGPPPNVIDPTTETPGTTMSSSSEPTPTTTEASTTTVEHTTIDPYEPECDVNQQFYAHPIFPDKYYICVGGKPILMTCPTPLLWNMNLLKCTADPNETTTVPEPTTTEISTTTVEHTTIDPYEPECDVNQQFYAHPIYPDKYYICVGGKPILMTCPTPLLWNMNLLKCTADPNETTIVPEPTTTEISTTTAEHTTIDPYEPECDVNQQFYSHPIYPDKYYICVGGIPILMTCPTPLLWNMNLAKCAVDPDETTTTEATVTTAEVDPFEPECDINQQFYPHPIYPDKYYICVGGVPLLMTCPTPLLWNIQDNRCSVDPSPTTMPPIETTTNEAVTDPFEPECDPSQQFYEHPIYPNKYYICIGGKPLLMTCPIPTIWHSENSKCYEDQVDPDLEDPNAPDCVTDEFYSHPDSNKYYICIGGKPIQMTCPKDHIWNQENRRCDLDSIIEECIEQFLPHPTDTSKYYECNDGITAEKQCPEDYLWNQKLQSCRPDCSHDDPYLPDVDDCSKYYICIGGSAVPMTCPAEHFWNDIDSKCDPDLDTHCN